jgi:hypothetical protein
MAGSQEDEVVKAGTAWKASGSSEDKAKVESTYTAYAEHMRGNNQTPKSLYNVLGYTVS